MFNWSAFTLFLYILARTSGFVVFNPILGRRDVLAAFKTGFILLMAVSAYLSTDATVAVPDTLLELALRLLSELGVGFVLGMVMQFFFYIAEQAGEIVDTQMGMSMAQTYNPASGGRSTPTSNILNAMMILLFFTANGHITLLRLLLTSGDVVSFGAVGFGDAVANRGVELFAQCVVLAVKLAFPILAAELMGQIGMGVLMKVIPQINVFAINIQLKIIIGLAMLFLLLAPFSAFLLEAESRMLVELELMLDLARG